MKLDSIESLDQAMEALKELEERMGKVESENSKLKASKQGLLTDLKKKKSVDAFLKVAGIELGQDATEEDIAEKIANLRAPRPADGEASSADALRAPSATQEQSPVASQASLADASQKPAQQAPSDAVSAAVEMKLATLQRRNDDLDRQLQEITKDRDRERAQRREVRLEQMILDELAKIDCKRPRHLFKLERENFSLLDDEATVMYGSGEDSMSLRDAVVRLKEDDEYSVYFGGSGATGSGLTPSRSNAHVSQTNPFATGSVNATLAAKLLSENPEQAKKLLAQARSSGKIDPVMAKAFATI